MVKKFAAWLLRVMVESGAFDYALATSPYIAILEQRMDKITHAPAEPTRAADAQNAASILWAELFGNETQHGGDSV